ncbi:hypothetical protein [Streptomyces sp. NPDC058155]|uniref:hypothetical protein n=1 Tax=Streptomyces sp. NPDC058155 TaxID=3346359 RepID=UPI0036E936FA
MRLPPGPSTTTSLMVPGHRGAVVAAPFERSWTAARGMAACPGSVPLRAALRAGQEDAARDLVTLGSGDSAVSPV